MNDDIRIPMGWKEPQPQRRRFHSMNAIWSAPTLDWRDFAEPERLSPMELQEVWRPSSEIEERQWKSAEPQWKEGWKQNWKPMDGGWKEHSWKQPEPSQPTWKQEWKSEPSWRDRDDTRKDWKTKDSRLRKTQSATGLKEKRLAPNRFVSRQLKSYIREPERNPIGLFMWGFGDSVKVKDIMQTFAEFGDFNNVGISTKNGIRYCFIDFDSLLVTQRAFQQIPERHYFGMTLPLQVRFRYDKSGVPSFDETQIPELDVRTVHIQNLPHNINKPEIERVLSQVGVVIRIKIFQRASEKKSSVFVSFRTPEMAQKSVHFLKMNPLIFKDMTNPLDLEYPAQDITRTLPVFATTTPAGLSKKARKQLAAENRIAYIRSNDPIDPHHYEQQLSIHGPVHVYPVKTVPPCTAFAVFNTPKACSEALQQKTMGCNLPRHKRVDFILQDVSEQQVLLFLQNVADIKQTSCNENILTVEFLTAIGSAKAIVKTKTDSFNGKYIQADYSPSIKPESENNSHMGEDHADNESETFTVATESLPPNENQDTNSTSYPLEEEVIKLTSLQITT